MDDRRNILSQTWTHPTTVSVPFEELKFKSGGVTLDLTTVATLAADATLADGSVVRAGLKYLRYGQVLARISASRMYGPYDPNATDGRQVLARGECFVLN